MANSLLLPEIGQRLAAGYAGDLSSFHLCAHGLIEFIWNQLVKTQKSVCNKARHLRAREQIFFINHSNPPVFREYTHSAGTRCCIPCRDKPDTVAETVRRANHRA